jgi:hypothetical protein
MAEPSNDSKFQFVVVTTPGVPQDPATKLVIRKKAMKAAAVTRRATGGHRANRLQYPPDVHPGPPSVVQSPIKHSSRSIGKDERLSDENKVIALNDSGSRFTSIGQDNLTPTHSDAPRMRQDLMAKIRAAQRVPAKVSAQGFELVSIKYGFDPINLSALTTLHIGRTTNHPFEIKSSQLTKLFRLQQHSYLSFLPSHYNESQCLNDAADCLFALARQLCSAESDVGSWALTNTFLYGRALQSLHQAINSEASRLAPETLGATFIMAMVEVCVLARRSYWCSAC